VQTEQFSANENAALFFVKPKPPARHIPSSSLYVYSKYIGT
jgi:hypothetical protein